MEDGGNCELPQLIFSGSEEEDGPDGIEEVLSNVINAHRPVAWNNGDKLGDGEQCVMSPIYLPQVTKRSTRRHEENKEEEEVSKISENVVPEDKDVVAGASVSNIVGNHDSSQVEESQSSSQQSVSLLASVKSVQSSKEILHDIEAKQEVLSKSLTDAQRTAQTTEDDVHRLKEKLQEVQNLLSNVSNIHKEERKRISEARQSFMSQHDSSQKVPNDIKQEAKVLLQEQKKLLGAFKKNKSLAIEVESLTVSKSRITQDTTQSIIYRTPNLQSQNTFKLAPLPIGATDSSLCIKQLSFATKHDVEKQHGLQACPNISDLSSEACNMSAPVNDTVHAKSGLHHEICSKVNSIGQDNPSSRVDSSQSENRQTAQYFDDNETQLPSQGPFKSLTEKLKEGNKEESQRDPPPREPVFPNSELEPDLVQDDFDDSQISFTELCSQTDSVQAVEGGSKITDAFRHLKVTNEQKKEEPQSLALVRKRYHTLRSLIDDSIITPGTNVLTMMCKGTLLFGTLTPDGKIRTESGDTYWSAEHWIFMKRKMKFTRHSAWKMVKYKGKPLQCYLPATEQQINLGKSARGEEEHNAEDRVTSFGLKGLPGSCGEKLVLDNKNRSNAAALTEIYLIEEDELCSSSNFLPEGFWTKLDFDKLEIDETFLNRVCFT